MNQSYGVQVEIVKGIPEEQIDKFEDKVVYYTAVNTREYTKSRRAYPHLSGDLEMAEIAAPITGRNKEYNLLAGLGYDKYVWKMTNVQWTNPSTIPQWYYTVFKTKGTSLLVNATIRAIKEIKK